MINVVFITLDGERIEHTGPEGDTVLDVALDNEVAGILGRCGGGCTCTTCHCFVEPEWLDLIPEPHQDELDMLPYVVGVQQDSRLACQIKLHPGLNGISVRLPERQL